MIGACMQTRVCEQDTRPAKRKSRTSNRVQTTREESTSDCPCNSNNHTWRRHCLETIILPSVL